MPLEYFKYTIFGLNKVLGSDGTMNATGSIYIIALDIQDIHTNVGYDFITHISNMIHNEIVSTQRGELKNFKFHHYSLLMQLNLFQNIDHIGTNFIEETKDFGENLPVQ